MSKKNIDNIGHEAHIFGAIGGIAIITLIKPDVLISFFNQLANAFNWLIRMVNHHFHHS